MQTDVGVRSYPTAKSRAVGLAAIVIFWVAIGARQLHQTWAPSPRFLGAVSLGLLATAKSFNVDVRFRAAATESEKRLVARLSSFKLIGTLGVTASVIWVATQPSEEFTINYVLPLCVFLISAGFMTTSAILYQPFVLADDDAGSTVKLGQDWSNTDD